jgi:hypothetical protein
LSNTNASERFPDLDFPPMWRRNWVGGFRSAPGTPSSTGRACTDRFNVGKRIFLNSHFALGPEWSLMALATYAVDAPVSNASRRRFDLVLSYDLLQRLRASRLL